MDDAAEAGPVGPPPVIASAVVVRNITGPITTATVTWTTTTPTLGLVRYGRGGAPIGRSWDPEGSFGMSHSFTVPDAPAGVLTWWVTARDQWGRTVTTTVSG